MSAYWCGCFCVVPVRAPSYRGRKPRGTQPCLAGSPGRAPGPTLSLQELQALDPRRGRRSVEAGWVEDHPGSATTRMHRRSAIQQGGSPNLHSCERAERSGRRPSLSHFLCTDAPVYCGPEANRGLCHPPFPDPRAPSSPVGHESLTQERQNQPQGRERQQLGHEGAAPSLAIRQTGTETLLRRKEDGD